MRSIVFKSTRLAVTKFTAAALLLLALTACNVGGDSGVDQSITIKPIELVAKGVDQGIDLSWDSVTGADSYTVYYHTDKFASGTASEAKSKKGIAPTKYRIDGLTNGTKYYLLVEAINAAGNILSASRIKSAIANLPVPTKLQATGRDKTVDLSWGKVEGATSYTVYYSKASFDKTADSRVTSKTAIKTTNTSITGLSADTTYYFRVIAISNRSGSSSEMSPIQSATTKLLALHPSAAASINSLAAVDLIWNPVAGVSGYTIYYAKQSLDERKGGYQDYLTVGGKYVTIDDTDTRTTIGDLSTDTTYYFVVAANYNGKKEATAPEVTADTSYIAELAMGGKHGCVRLNTGSIKCWGRNEEGQLGLGEGDKTNRYAATSVDLRAKQLSAGDDHSCAIDLEGNLYCWGDNDYLQLGLSNKDIDRTIPTKVEQANLAKASLITAGSTSTCAQAGNHNYCWGSQAGGGLGDGVASEDSTKDAKPIKNIDPAVKQFALGRLSGCAIDASGALWCWGLNYFGQVGDGTDGADANQLSPVNPKLKVGSTATMLAGKSLHYCVVDNASKIQCWGNNSNGQLGINSGDYSNNIPQYVLASTSKTNPVHLEGVSKIATGNQHSCALIAEGGKVRCWGWSGYGETGIKGEANRLVANADMEGINNAIDIAAGDDFTCVLLEDKARVKCWGLNEYGQLGVSRHTKSSSEPVAVAGLTAITKLPPISIPTPPTELHAIGKNKAIDLSWGAVTGAISYKVYYHTISFDKTTVSLAKSKTVIAAINTSITGLSNGTEYFIRLVASNTKGDSGLSGEASATTELPAPTKLGAAGKDKAIDLSWDAVTDATSYKVYYHTTSFDNTYDIGVKSTTDDIEVTNTSIKRLTNGQTYHFRVVAYIGSVPSQPSIAATGTPNLSRPTGLEASSGYQSVALSWNGVSGADGYWVYYHTDKDVSPKSNNVKNVEGGNNIKTVITKLKNNTEYYFVIVAYQGSSNSQPSSPVSATPKLAPPANLRAVSSGEQAVTLSWDIKYGVDGYYVYYHTSDDVSPSPSKHLGFRPLNDAETTSVKIEGLTGGQIYHFVVVAHKGGSSSSPSTKVSAVPSLAPPTNLNAIGIYQGIDLSWSKVDGAASYTVYYHTASFDSSTKGVKSKTGIKTTNTSIAGLINGTKYYLRVEVISASGAKKLSAEVSAIANLPAPPTNLNATGVIKAVDLSWDAVTGATRYTVYYHTASFDKTTDNGVISIIVAAKTKISVKRLANGTTYYFRVVASNPIGSSALSQIQSATTTLVAPHPSAATSISLAAVDLSWDAVVGATGYKIYYAKDSLDDLNGGYLNYAKAKDGKLKPTTATSITIGDLSADTTYYFVVAANYKGGEAAAPELTADPLYIAELAMGGVHGCVRLNTGRIKCWGWNYYGGLGVGYKEWVTPTATSVPNFRAKQLSAGGGHSCAIDLSDSLYCWGWNSFSQLGLSGYYSSYSPTLVTQPKLANVSLVTTGYSSTCALAAGNNYCWGYQEDGALGNGVASSDSTMDAQKIKDITPDVKQFALGDDSGCAIDASDDLWCWGRNDYGQVGNGKSGKNKDQPSPVKPKLQGSSFATMVSGKDEHYCVVDNAKKVQCWGRNVSGQLGINNKYDKNKPQYVLDSTSDHLSNVSKIAIGANHSCAIIAGGKVRCWGESSFGRIGDATEDRLVADTDMKGINNAIDIAAGYSFTCVLLADRARVKCWGRNYYGQLGNGRSGRDAWGVDRSSSMPVAVKGLTVIPKPTPPTELHATGKNKAIDLSWGAVTDATSYKVYYHTASFDNTSDIGVQSTDSVTGTKISIEGLDNGQTYYFKVVAYTSSVPSQPSIAATGTPNLSRPTGLEASSGYESVALSWNGMSGADGYWVYYHTDKDVSPNKKLESQQVESGNTKTVIKNLNNNTKYYFVIVSYQEGSSNSKPSSPVSATPELAPPKNLHAVSSGEQAVTLSWDIKYGVDGYYVYYHTVPDVSPDKYSGVNWQAGADNTSVKIEGLTAGISYHFVVVAHKGGSSSLPSTKVSAVPSLAPPTNLNATGVIKAVDLSWDAVTGATKYTVYYSEASFDNTYDSGVNGIIVAAKTKISVKRLANGTTYYFRVIASNPIGSSALSPIQSATTKLPALHPSAAASIYGAAAVDLSWDAVVGATGYKIYYAKVSLDDLNGGYENYAAVGGKDATADATTDTSITIGDLSFDTTYYFVVAANYKGGEAVAPEITADSSYIAELAMGGEHSCVRLNTGGIKCWGSNFRGQLGLGDETVRKIATSVPDFRAKQLSAGGWHSCAIDLNDKLYCWGRNSYSQLGLSGGDISNPTLVTQANFDKLSLVSAGWYSTCAVAAGNNYCWGDQEYGALGDGVKSDTSTPIAQPINDITPDVQQFALGRDSGCAIDVSADLWCWGRNDEGQVGDGTNTDQPSPVKPKLQGSSKATMVDSGYDHYCVVDNTKKIQCWGGNVSGQLGINNKYDKNKPQYVLASKSDYLEDVSKIAAGVGYSCALLNSGKVRCWGWAYQGRIGINVPAADDHHDDRPLFAYDRLIADTDMPGITNAIDIAAGHSYTCVLLADRARVKCWGIGYLGGGRYTSSHTPVAVQGL